MLKFRLQMESLKTDFPSNNDLDFPYEVFTSINFGVNRFPDDTCEAFVKLAMSQYAKEGCNTCTSDH